MNDTMPALLGSSLQVIGSLASVIAIPLSIYLYLRSKEAKHLQLRREVARVLSHQIGEGRQLSLFETLAVIESKTREYGVRGAPLSVSEVIEDLVAETITNPMLESERKSAITANLQGLHSLGVIHRLLVRYHPSPQLLADALSRTHKLTPEDSALLVAEGASPRPFPVRRSPYAELFGILAALTSTLAFAISTLTSEKLFPKFELPTSSLPLFGILLGAAASVLALVISSLYVRERERRRRKEQEATFGAEAPRKGVV